MTIIRIGEIQHGLTGDWVKDERLGGGGICDVETNIWGDKTEVKSEYGIFDDTRSAYSIEKNPYQPHGQISHDYEVPIYPNSSTSVPASPLRQNSHDSTSWQNNPGLTTFYADSSSQMFPLSTTNGQSSPSGIQPGDIVALIFTIVIIVIALFIYAVKMILIGLWDLVLYVSNYAYLRFHTMPTHYLVLICMLAVFIFVLELFKEKINKFFE